MTDQRPIGDPHAQPETLQYELLSKKYLKISIFKYMYLLSDTTPHAFQSPVGLHCTGMSEHRSPI